MKPFKGILFTLIIVFSASTSGQEWIWFPGDYENWVGTQMNNRRTERGVDVPVQWKMDNHEPLMIFTKEVNLPEAEEIEIYAEGDYVISIGRQIRLNGNENEPTRVTVPAGEHEIEIKVINYATVPALFVQGKTIKSDTNWMASPLEENRVTVNMEHPDSPSGYYMQAGTGGLNDPSVLPSEFRLETRPMEYADVQEYGNGILYDFGKETFGFIKFHNLSGSGEVRLQYGETDEEALSSEHCETFYTFEIPRGTADHTVEHSNALRYVFLVADDADYDDISLMYEYSPVEYRGSFTSSDEELNKIWEVGQYTLHLTTREIFIDGIKRDRWAWSGDAYQSYLMNYYTFFDSETVKRTIYTLRGSDPVMVHINNIMDYTLYWFMGVYDYYLYSGDKHFVRQVYPKMESLMDFVLERRNERGLLEGLQGDWVYVDWIDHPVDKSGEVSFEQILLAKSLETMTACAEILGVDSEAARYADLAKGVRDKLDDYWDEEQQAVIFNRVDGQNSEQVTKHANMFSVIHDYVTDLQKEQIKSNVLLNDEIPALSTPYMRFYELEALCQLGEHEYVLNEIKDYWGGMLELGATSFWEKYNPEHEGLEHYAMYGRPFGKSLCHAWGASPIYLLGKYFAGVKPVTPGYEEFEVRPVLGGLDWFECSVPTPDGDIEVYTDDSRITVTATEGAGNIIFHSQTTPETNRGTIRKTGETEYTLPIEGDGQEVTVEYTSVER